MSDSLRDKSLTAFLWVLIDKAGGSVANFLVTIILARLLMPEDFGLVAMVMIFFEISNSFIQSGFAFALIREKTISDEDKSTTFIFNLVTAVFLYIVLFFAAPAIATFFRQDLMIPIVRVMGLNLIISAISFVQRTELIQRIDFKTQTKVRLVAVLISGACAILMAKSGFGVWSLVARLGVMELMSTIFLWMVNPWTHAVRFSVRSFKKLFGFGSKLLMEDLIDKFFKHLLQILIGRYYSVTTLGFFAQANNFCNMAANNFLQTIQNVTYPVLSKLQDDREKLKDGYRRVITMSSFFIIPVMVLMCVLAEPMIISMVGYKWLPSVPFLQLLCLAGATYHFNAINLDLLMVLGRVDLVLKLEIIKKIITATAIAIGIQFGIYGLVIAQVVSSYISLFINTWYSDKFLKYSLLEQAKDILPSVAFSVLTGFLLILIEDTVRAPALWYFLGGSVVGGIIYLGLHFLFHTKEIDYLRSFIIPRTKSFFSPKLK